MVCFVKKNHINAWGGKVGQKAQSIARSLNSIDDYSVPPQSVCQISQLSLQTVLGATIEPQSEY